MKRTILNLSALLLASLAALRASDTFLVEDGQPRAEMLVSDKPQRTARLAAQELQDGIQKISSARPPTEPAGRVEGLHAEVSRCRERGAQITMKPFTVKIGASYAAMEPILTVDLLLCGRSISVVTPKATEVESSGARHSLSKMPASDRASRSHAAALW
jgi:hypothetical protein